MADTRFYSVRGPFTVTELAETAQADLREGVDGSKQITDIAPLDAAGGDAISFIDNKRYFETFTKTRAGACIAVPKFADRAPPGTSILLSETPSLAFARVARAFYPPPRVEGGDLSRCDRRRDGDARKRVSHRSRRGDRCAQRNRRALPYRRQRRDR